VKNFEKLCLGAIFFLSRLRKRNSKEMAKKSFKQKGKKQNKMVF